MKFFIIAAIVLDSDLSSKNDKTLTFSPAPASVHNVLPWRSLLLEITESAAFKMREVER